MIATSLWSAYSMVRGSWITKWLSIALIGFTAYWGHKTFIERRAVKAFISDSKQEGQAKNEISEGIREDASQPGAAARLLKSDCRDCR